jgi:NEDD8-activating enzyme E1 regulatory subunit
MATTDKYDRQLRLWGAKGQRALGETSVLLIRATAAGTETLKNLVLPGVGHFHILDDMAGISKWQSASNFFLPQPPPPPLSSTPPTTTTLSRAAVACQQLLELNPDVKGTFQHVNDLAALQEEDWRVLLRSGGGVSSTSKQTLVIASDLEPPLLDQVSQACHDSKIPMIMVVSYGLLGIVRLQTPPLALLDPKPTNAPPDLRLVSSFPAFIELANSIDWTALDDKDHSHMPYPLILYKVSQDWKVCHDGKLPQTFAEKQEFRQSIAKVHARDMDKELNFQEAMENAYLAYTERTADWMEELLSGGSGGGDDDDLDPSSTLALLLGALQKFMVAHDGRPPLNGSIPDMTASTDIYVKLQTIYRDQAARDLQEIKSYLPQPLPSMSDGDEDVAPTATVIVSDDDVTSFCSNVYAISRLQTRTLIEEYNAIGTTPPSDELIENWSMAAMDPYDVKEHTPLIWYLAFRACQLFFRDHRRYPGVVDNDDDWESDVPILQALVQKVVEQCKLQDNEMIQEVLTMDKEQKVAHELTRYANAEIHTIASVVGGVASQEAVKIIAGQYIPLDNTYCFNGIVSVGGVYKF